MATSSMLRSVTIKDKGQCRKLICALERAESMKSTKKPAALKARDMTPEQMREIFGQGSK